MQIYALQELDERRSGVRRPPRHFARTMMSCFALLIASAMITLTTRGVSGNVLEGQGPVIVLEPPARLEFTNSTGTRLDCSAQGSPAVSVTWTASVGLNSPSGGGGNAQPGPVPNVPGLRHQLLNGSLLFLPFPASAYRPDVHASAYRCVATNSVGRVLGREVRLKAVHQHAVNIFTTIIPLNLQGRRSAEVRTTKSIGMAEIYQHYNSTIPWNPNFPTDFEIEDTTFFEGGNFRNDEEKQRQLGCFRYFNEAFPFFIPMEHHRMSVEGITKSSPKGQYWGLAIHFLISTKGHGSEHWKDFQRQLRHEEITCHPYISDTTRLKLLPNGAPQCNSSEDYFFEPALLLQIPYEILDYIDEPTMIVATEEDNGILVSIFQSKISLRAESETFIEFRNRTNNESRETDSTLKIFEPMKIEEISKHLKHFLEIEKKNWSLRDGQLTYLKNFLQTPGTVLPSASDDPLMIANHFEQRIKQFVASLTMKKHPVYSFAQYMLPCFVASFLEMISVEESPVRTETKEWLLKFLNKLVSLYEAIATHRTPMDEWAKITNENFALQIKYRLSSHTLLLSYFRRVTGLLISVLTRGIASREYFRFDLFPAFYEALDHGNTQWFPLNTPNEEISNRVNDKFLEQVYDFFRKIEISLEDAFGSKQPTLASLWAPDMADLIRTLCLVGLPKQPKRLHYIALKSYSKLLYDILKSLTSIDEVATKKEISGLAEDQKLSLAFYLTMKHISRGIMMDTLGLNESELSKIDTTSSDSAIAFHSYLMGGEMWPLRKFYSKRLGFKNAVSLDYAKKSAPICYSLAMREIDLEQNKLKMASPGESWFYPIKHCRFCGSLKDPTEFKICAHCEKHQEYPDKNYFCSQKCEENAMSAYHRMEHSHYARLEKKQKN
ncbi:Hypothetical predicted protein [Cloeon dipterum]|uniref:Ig-like domain-containing protein n=1 Tax=Cloeon dipterum TaxID=197152 RepID=A0A8S1DA46_9INSE|nr:Hypothetical predicted protein [Cloeon dipterum]